MSRTELEAEYPASCGRNLASRAPTPNTWPELGGAAVDGVGERDRAMLQYLRSTYRPAWLAGFHLVEHATRRRRL